MTGTPGSLAHLKTYWTAYVVLVLTLSLSCVAYFGHNSYVRSRNEARFARSAEAAVEQVRVQLREFVTMMNGVRALFAASDHVSPSELTNFFRMLQLDGSHQAKGLAGVGVIYAVPFAERAAHVELMRKAYPEYRLRTESTNGPAFPVVHLDRLGQGPEMTALGWDVGRDAARREAMLRASEHGQTVATAKTRLLYSDQTEVFPGFVFYLPIFRAPELAGGSARGGLLGFVFSSFDAQKLWQDLFASHEEFADVRIYDGTAAPENLLFNRDGVPGAEASAGGAFEREVSAELFGRRWTFAFRDQALDSPFFEHGLPLLLFSLAIVSSFLLFGFVFFQAKSRATAERLTASVQASEEIARLEKERLAVTLRSISDAVVTTDSAGRVLLMNPVAENMAGVPQNRALGRPIQEIFPLADADSRAPCAGDLEQVIRGEPSPVPKPALLTRPDGSEILVQKRAAQIRDEDGEATGVVFVFRDVTQERKIEEERVRASKLESVGLLAGGIAHDFNNVLTGIVGNLSLLRDTPNLPAEMTERLSLLENTAYKARQLTLQLLTFAKGGSPIKQMVSIGDVVREAAEFALRGSNVRAEYHFPAELPALEVDPGQVSQVVHNLIINSKQAMPQGGSLGITAESFTADKGVNLPLAAGNYVRVSFRDSGTGIKAEHLGKIFDPYFTTKSSGSGLGLATAYSIMKRHDGLITVESEWGSGSTFHLYFPASNTKLRPQGNSPELSVKGCGRVLAMDDDPAIRNLLCAVLTHFGYKPVAVADGREAILEYQRARSAGEPYNAVIMDLTIPGGMGGKETIAELLRIDPEVRAIVSSGYSNDPVLAEYKKHGFRARAEKPFRMQELAAALNEILDEEHKG